MLVCTVVYKIHLYVEIKCSRYFYFLESTLKIAVTMMVKTLTGCNNWHIRAKSDIGGGTIKIVDVNIRSFQAAPEEESGTVEE